MCWLVLTAYFFLDIIQADLRHLWHKPTTGQSYENIIDVLKYFSLFYVFQGNIILVVSQAMYMILLWHPVLSWME